MASFEDIGNRRARCFARNTRRAEGSPPHAKTQTHIQRRCRIDALQRSPAWADGAGAGRPRRRIDRRVGAQHTNATSMARGDRYSPRDVFPSPLFCAPCALCGSSPALLRPSLRRFRMTKLRNRYPRSFNSQDITPARSHPSSDFRHPTSVHPKFCAPLCSLWTRPCLSPRPPVCPLWIDPVVRRSRPSLNCELQTLNWTILVSSSGPTSSLHRNVRT